MWLKACPKCEGDLYLRHEIDGKDIVCLQCGYIRHTLPERVKVAGRQQRQFAKRRIAA
jgi:Zn ribbon nucleic-acid-binding protein